MTKSEELEAMQPFIIQQSICKVLAQLGRNKELRAHEAGDKLGSPADGA
jgi:hypothetical protein